MSTEPTTVGDGAGPASAGTGFVSSPGGAASDLAARVQERPEVAVGGAFAGGLILALVLKRLAR